MSMAREIPAPNASARGALMRGIILAITSFLTQVDLFAAQAILPALTESYAVSPATMGFAVNASTIGMALAGLGVALIASKINRKWGIVAALFLLAVPTFAIAFGEDITTFTLLRIAQGLCMSAAFTLTMAYLAENCTVEEAAGAMAAYITGAVASNLVGRLLATVFLTQFGVEGSFIAFGFLNLAGAAFVAFTLGSVPRKDTGDMAAPNMLEVWRIHLSNPRLLASFAIGFLILFVFIGVFTFVNFVLAAPPFELSATARGLVYFVFAPAIVITPLAGGLAIRFGQRRAFWAGIIVTVLGLALAGAPNLPLVLTGLALVSVGLFFAQAVATGFIGQAATADRAAASGLYLASYYTGGLLGAIVLGQVFGAAGWTGALIVSAVLMVAAAGFGASLHLPDRRS